MALPKALLTRPGPLTQVELEYVRRHPTIGAALAAHVLDDEQAAWLLHHHERPDGSGYPSGLTAALIPDGARIIAIADAFDAMTSERGYQPIRTTDEALAEIERDIPGAEALLRGALSWWSSR